MLKITKKIKKKHKHKRGKDEELFTPEELERYKQQQAEKAQQAAAAAAAEALDEAAGGGSGFVAGDGGAAEEAGEGATGGGPEEGSEEWQRFKALTAGVDDILKKSQGDLGRIKSTSFFQRKPPGFTEPDKEKKKRPERPAAPVVADKHWVGFEEGARVNSQEQEVVQEQQQEEVVEEVPAAEVFPEEEEEEDLEPEDDGLFDTSYVDVVTSGDIKLAYIPDSPPPEEEEGDDPFDTSIVDKVIKPTEIITKDGKKKTLVSLGCAVDVLTGRLDKAIPQTIVVQGTKKRRVQPRDLLFDDGTEVQVDLSPPELTSVNAPKSLLDDDSEVIPDDLPVNVTVPVAVTPQTAVLEEYKEEDNKSDLKNLVAEFDIINTTEEVETVVSEESDDEFAALAAESVLKSYDPFDTSVAEVALGEVSKPKFPGSPDVDVLLRSDSPSWDSTETLQKHPPRPPPPRPQPINSGAEADPFDTSFAENLVPGKVELSLIESEILGEVTSGVQQEVDDDDFDFDPRAGESQNNVPADVISSVTIHVSAPVDDAEEESGEEFEPEQEEEIPEPVALQPAHRDLLGGSSTDLSTLAHDPIEPEVETELDVGSEDFDPFDTSVVTVLAPGKAELRVLEEELLTQPAAGTVDLSDDDFDPRGGSDAKPDLLPETINSTTNLPSPSSRPDLLGEGGENDKPPIFKPLTPLPGNQNDDVSPGDPFDTTFAENIAPGKAELRLIESELVLKRSLSDEDFNPRDETTNTASASRRYSELPSVLQVTVTSGRRFSDVTGDHKQLPPSSLPLQRVVSPPPDRPDLLAVAEEDEEAPHKPLTPAQESARPLAIPDDPFDTSQVSPAIAPGPAELRQLENELRIDEPPPPLTRSYTDEDFNPRDAPPAPQQPAEKPDLLHLPDEAGDDFKPLSPQLDEDDNRDPFDTSFAGDLLPGRAELKLLEAELIG